MKNKVGFNVLAWSAVVSDELKPIIDRLKTIGYDGGKDLGGIRFTSPLWRDGV